MRIYIILSIFFLLSTCSTPIQRTTSNLPVKSTTSVDSAVVFKKRKQPNFVIHPFYRAALKEIYTPKKTEIVGDTIQKSGIGSLGTINSLREKDKLESNAKYYTEVFDTYRAYVSDGFDFPVGKPNAYGYFRALRFGNRGHMGEDWNSTNGGSSDLGDPVYSISNGLVVLTEAYPPELRWGKVVRVIYKMPQGTGYNFVEAVYAHLDEIHINEGDLVTRGQQIGTIGDAYGAYSPHLHFELRYLIDTPLGRGYDMDGQYGHIDPTDFIKTFRPPL